MLRFDGVLMRHYGSVFVAILVFLALMMLMPLWRMATGAKLARARAVQIRTPLWIAWMIGLLTGGAVLVGAFLGGAGKSGLKAVLAVIAAVGLGGYMMWRAGFRRARGADRSTPKRP